MGQQLSIATQLLLELKDEREKDFLLKLLGQFDFVRVVPQDSPASKSEPVNGSQEEEEIDEDGENGLLSYAGSSSHWTVTAEELRHKAWGRDKK